jgi:hypothetical protein
MSEPLELKKAKIDSLVREFTNAGYKSINRIGQSELLDFLNKHTASGHFDTILSDKLFQVLSLDHMSTMLVEDFINGFLQFEEDIRRNTELYHIKLNQEQEIYNRLVEQCRIYREEKLNAEGLCENAKVFGEITDIDVKKKLEGIKEIIIKVVYNDKSEELHFKIGVSSNEMLNKSFAFKPQSRKDHFEFIMKGVNDRNQVFDIGSKVFPLNDVNSHEEYVVEIVVPEIDNEEEVAAFIHAKIVLYFSDYKYYERQRRKSESRLKKLITATNRANEYLKYVREIYGDLTKKRRDLVVDFNNEKLMQRKGAKLNVQFNNQKEAETSGNYVVEFNNLREVKKVEEKKVKEETKIVKETKTETIKEEVEKENKEKEKTEVKEQKEATQASKPEVKESGPYITKVDEEPNVQNYQNYQSVQETQVITNYNQPMYQESVPYITNVTEDQNIDYLNAVPTQQTDYSYQNQYVTNDYQSGFQGYNTNDYYQQGFTNGGEITTTTTTNYEYNQNNYSTEQQGMQLADTIGYGSSDNMGNVEAYGTGGLEYIDQNPSIDNLRNSEVIKQTEFRTSVRGTLVNESRKKALVSHSTLPVKVLETKVNKVIYDSNVKTLRLIYGRTNVSYGQGYGNTAYSASI